MKYKVIQTGNGSVRVYKEIDAFVEKRDGLHEVKQWDDSYKEFSSWNSAMNFIYDRNDARHPDSSSLLGNIIHQEIIDV